MEITDAEVVGVRGARPQRAPHHLRCTHPFHLRTIQGISEHICSKLCCTTCGAIIQFGRKKCHYPTFRPEFRSKTGPDPGTVTATSVPNTSVPHTTCGALMHFIVGSNFPNTVPGSGPDFNRNSSRNVGQYFFVLVDSIRKWRDLRTLAYG